MLRFGSTRANVRSAARGNMVSTLRGKAPNIASHGSRAQSIRGVNKKAQNWARFSLPSQSVFLKSQFSILLISSTCSPKLPLFKTVPHQSIYYTTTYTQQSFDVSKYRWLGFDFN
jgi:hypothetical protein